MSWKVGDRVRVEGYDCDGTVAFVGLHHEKEKPRVGVILDEPIGKGKGSFGGHQYFTCDTVSAVLVLPKKVSAAGSVFFEPGVVETEAGETETVRARRRCWRRFRSAAMWSTSLSAVAGSCYAHRALFASYFRLPFDLAPPLPCLPCRHRPSLSIGSRYALP